jgi:hypothetical protein
MGLSVEPVPDGWYVQLAAECVAGGVRVGHNEHGTPVSIHVCHTCGQEFTVCPPSPRYGRDCTMPECASYDPATDAEVFFAPDDPALIERR